MTTPQDIGANPSYKTLGHLSIAPATHTTVVTTTTTTTTSFPPMRLSPPRNLRDRDSKDYPLAHVPTPTVLRQFPFYVDGIQARFEETDDDCDQTTEHNHQRGEIGACNGRVETIQTFKSPPQFANPSRSALATLWPNANAPPPSIAEAANIAKLHRRGIKAPLRGGGSYLNSTFTPEEMEDGIPATPDTDTGGPGSFKVPSSRRSNRPAHGRSFSGPSNPHNESSDQVAPSTLPGHRYSPIGLEGPGVAATPPIAETDLEPVGPFSAMEGPLAPLDTLSAQDASLPSPSLSPITAAATALHNDGSFNDEAVDEESTDVSNLDISQLNPLGRPRMPNFQEQSRSSSQLLDFSNLSHDANPQLPTPSIMDVPAMLHSFDALPEKMKTFVMYQFLRRCTKPTLHFIADVVNPALKVDFFGLLPLELSLNIVKFLDVKTMCSAAQVSKKWRHILDTDETAWKDLLERDGFSLPAGEVDRAVTEGWGWQYPHSAESYERDLRPLESEPTLAHSISSHDSLGSSGRSKRKALSKLGPSKKQRRKGPSSSSARSLSMIGRRQISNPGPIAYAEVAAAAIPSPNIGLPGLRSMHLFKSLYQRHHLIRKSWMQPDSEPKHIAFRAHQRHVVTCLQFDTDKIITGSDDTNINVYDTKTGALRSRLEGHEGGVWALQYEGNTMVSGSTDRSVRVWDIEAGKCTHVFQGHTSTVRCLVILNPTKVGEKLNGEPIMRPEVPYIITGSRDSTLRVWRLPTNKDNKDGKGQPTLPPVALHDTDNPWFVRVLNGHHHSVRAIAAHGDTLVSGSYDCTVRVWNISTGEVLFRLQGHAQKVYSVVLDHERNRCISGSMDNLVKVWSLETGQCLFTLDGHTSLVGLLDLSHERLVSAAADSTLRIWDPENGACKSILCAHTGAITCFQHDGQKVISGSDKTLKMWNVKTGEFVKDLLTDLSGVWQVKFNERRCVAAVQRDAMTYIEVLDFGAWRDGVPADQRGRRIVVNHKGYEVEEAAFPAEVPLL